MIEWNKSAELNKIGIDELKMWFEKYPSSGRRIIVICEECDREREIYFNAYRDLCKHCAMNKESTLKKLSDAAIRQWNVPGAREDHSNYMKQAFIDGDERFEKQGKSLKQFFKENPDKLKEMSERAKQYHIDHPDVAEYHSSVMRNSDAAKAASDAQRGGNDIIQHHWLYDDADLTKYTMPMTRSDHGKMHRRMQLDGYEVKRINSVEDDNRLWGYR